MTLPTYLTLLIDYHTWATERSLAEAAALSPAQYFQPQSHSWGSVHALLVHTFDAEWIWLRRCQGESPRVMPGADAYPDLPTLRAAWTEHLAALRRYLAALTPAELQAELSYTNTQGRPYRLARWQILVHLTNHATHHRGELAAMFTQLGAPHGEDDLLFYLLQVTGQKRV